MPSRTEENREVFGADRVTRPLKKQKPNSRKAGIAPEREPDAPKQDWARSIRRNPKELFKAKRDASKLVQEVLKDRQQQNTERGTEEVLNGKSGVPEQPQNKTGRENVDWGVIDTRGQDTLSAEAQGDVARAQEAQEKISAIKASTQGQHGTDMNLTGTDLSSQEEMVLSAADKGTHEVADLRNAAADKQAAAKDRPVVLIGRNEAIQSAKKSLEGKAPIVTDAQPGMKCGGTLLVKTDTEAIVKICKNQAVIFNIKDHAQREALEPGREYSFTKERDGKVSIKDPTQEKAAQKQEKTRGRDGLGR